MASASHAQARAAVAEPLAPPRRRGASKKQRAHRARARGGILWIAVSGILLAGVVFVNVAVLRLNLALDGATADRVKLHAENAALQSELSSKLRAGAIQAQASKQLGLQYQDPSEYGYVDLGK
jgi:cell division protein FtsL